MSLIPGTLPSGSCYGTPQQLLELFSQYLDVPAFAVSSKVLYSSVSPSPNTDYVWINTTGGDTPLLNLYNDATGGYEPFPFAGGVSSNERLISDKSAITTLVNADLLLVSTLSGGSYSSLKKITFSNAVSQIPSGAITPAQLAQPFTSATAIATTSGTYVDFTGIPSWAKRVTIAFNRVRLSGVEDLLVQLGTSSGSQTSLYESGSNASFSTSGFVIRTQNSTYEASGIMVLATLGGNIWASAHTCLIAYGLYNHAGGGYVPLAGTLTQVRITNTNTTTNNFTFGSVNIMYD